MIRYVKENGTFKVDWEQVEMAPENLVAASRFKDFLTLYCDQYLDDHPDLKQKMGDYCIRIIVSCKI